MTDPSTSPSFDPARAVKGAFSTREKVRLGFGTTARMSESLIYWYVEQTGADRFEARKLSTAHLPSEEVLTLDAARFLDRFTPEIDHYNARVRPAMQGVERALARGDTHRETGRLYSAQAAYEEVLGVDEDNVRATFGLGLTYLAREDDRKAREVFDRLVEMEAAFLPRHKHMFNEFGIELRKSKLFDEALFYYFRAMEMGCEDEHLLFNIARVYYEKGDWAECFRHLALCLETNQGVAEALEFCGFILAKTSRPEGQGLLARSAGRMQTDANYLVTRLLRAAGMTQEEALARRATLKKRMEAEARRKRQALEDSWAARGQVYAPLSLVEDGVGSPPVHPGHDPADTDEDLFPPPLLEARPAPEERPGTQAATSGPGAGAPGGPDPGAAAPGRPEARTKAEARPVPPPAPRKTSGTAIDLDLLPDVAPASPASTATPIDLDRLAGEPSGPRPLGATPKPAR